MKFLLPFFLIFTLSALGQGQESMEQIKAMKSSHIAGALNLTSVESKKFWVLYLAAEDKQYEIRNKIKTLTSKINEKGIDKMKTQDAQMYVIELQEAEEELFMTRKKLIADLKPIIGPKKILNSLTQKKLSMPSCSKS